LPKSGNQSNPTHPSPSANLSFRLNNLQTLPFPDQPTPAPSNATPHGARLSTVSNSEHSSGLRTESAKQRSSLNAMRHGLTAKTAVLHSERLVQELADTSCASTAFRFSKPVCSIQR
jgi:hypothetical protein